MVKLNLQGDDKMPSKYPEDILKMLRQRKGLEENDTSIDDKLNDMSKNKAFREVLNWKGFLGSWDVDIKNWIKNIYGIDLDKID